MKLRALIVILALAGTLMVAPSSSADGPGLQPGFTDALCPRPVDTDCATIAYPAIDVWSVSAILPVKNTDAAPDAEAVYDSLVPEPFTVPAERELAVLMFRLDIPTNPTSTATTDPGEGYAEGSVAIKVGFPAAHGFPYSEGFWNLAQPLNDPAQYEGGRSIGLPKYMAEAEVRRNADGTWTAGAEDWGKVDVASPGSEPVPGGNTLQIDWSPGTPPTGADTDALWRWAQYGDPLFVQTVPYDEVGSHDPAMVKFTTTGLTPLFGVPRTPASEYPDPEIGTATVTLEGDIPGAGNALTAASFSDLIAPGPHTVGGAFAYARGHAFLTIDNLENNTAT